MKKILSLIMLFVMLMLLCSFSVAATTETESVTSVKSENSAAIYTIGDVNCDDNVNIKDATAIQKWLADFITLSKKECLAADVDGDGKLSVKDATAIQKWLANIEIEFLIGEQDVIDSLIEYINDKTFSSQINKYAPFTDDCIIVMPKNSRGSEYTLDDFPEYKFRDIERVGGSDYVLCYILYLKNPGRENIIEAIEALDYRADIDLDYVQPNYIQGIMYN